MHEYSAWLANTALNMGDVEREFEVRLTESSTLAFRVAFSVLRHREDAEDVTQEAFAKPLAGIEEQDIREVALRRSGSATRTRGLGRGIVGLASDCTGSSVGWRRKRCETPFDGGFRPCSTMIPLGRRSSL
jgi:hypothetical protein